MSNENAAPPPDSPVRELAEAYGMHAYNDGLDHYKRHAGNPVPPPCFPSERTQVALSHLLDACRTAPPMLAGAPVVPGHYWLINDGVSTLRCVYGGRRELAGKLVVVIRGLSHTCRSEEVAPVTDLAGVWFGPLQPPHVSPAPLEERARA